MPKAKARSEWIRWGKAQQTKVIEMAAELLTGDPDLRELDVARLAQAMVLKPEEQRPILSLTPANWAWFREGLARRVKELRAKPSSPNNKPSSPSNTPPHRPSPPVARPTDHRTHEGKVSLPVARVPVGKPNPPRTAPAPPRPIPQAPRPAPPPKVVDAPKARPAAPAPVPTPDPIVRDEIPSRAHLRPYRPAPPILIGTTTIEEYPPVLGLIQGIPPETLSAPAPEARPAPTQSPPEVSASDFGQVVALLEAMAAALQEHLARPAPTAILPTLEPPDWSQLLPTSLPTGQDLDGLRDEVIRFGKALVHVDTRITGMDRWMEKIETCLIRMTSSLNAMGSRPAQPADPGQAGPAPPVKRSPTFRKPHVLVIGLDSGHHENHIKVACKDRVGRLEFKMANGVTMPDHKPWDYIMVTKKAPMLWVAAAKTAIPREKYRDTPGNAENVAKAINSLPQIKVVEPSEPEANPEPSGGV